MAKEIRWSVRADQERFDILQYWTNRNKSTSYSLKLNKLLNDRIEQLIEHPEIGKSTNRKSIRLLIVKDYLVYYKISSNAIEILSVWDSQRNPQKFKL